MKNSRLKEDSNSCINLLRTEYKLNVIKNHLIICNFQRILIPQITSLDGDILYNKCGNFKISNLNIPQSLIRSIFIAII